MVLRILNILRKLCRQCRRTTGHWPGCADLLQRRRSRSAGRVELPVSARADLILNVYVPRRRRRPASASRAGAGWLALVRLSGCQSHRAAHGRPRRRRPHGVAALVLSDSGGRRAARSGARDRDATISIGCRARKTPYAGRTQLESGLKALLAGTRRIAMEYSPNGAIPYVSRVDAGTIELVRGQGVDVVSSGDLVQQFEAHWSDDGHRRRTARRPRSCIASRIARSRRSAARSRDGIPTTEFDIQQLMWQWFDEEGLISDCGADGVGAGERQQSALPARRRATAARSAATSCCCSTCGASCETPGAVFADITWVGFTGSAGAGRDDATSSPPCATRATRRSTSSKRRPATGREVRGFELDRAARAVIEQAGLRRVTSCIAPGTAWARPCTATARTWTTTRRTTNAGCCPAPASRSSRASISTALACGRRSTWCGRRAGPEVTGPRQQEIVSVEYR